jgi:ParB family chromosome partitioning protein
MQTPSKDKPAGAKRKKQALGRGLEALIPATAPAPEQDSDFFYCDVSRIRPNRFQPRRHFAEDELAELADSIREQGVLQPILVRKIDAGYELITGERRLRAAKQAGLERVPAVLKEVDDDKLLEISIVENIQREDLNPIEEAEAYHCLITQFALTQDQAAARVGKSRSAVANFLRLRQLPPQIKTSITDKTLSMGHARALLGAENEAQQLTAWRMVQRKGLTVRQTEALIRRLKNEKKQAKVSPKSSEHIYFTGLAEELSRTFGTKVSIKKAGQRGRIEIEFFSDADLDQLIERLRQTPR